MNRFTGRRVLITGAGSGIGRATALRIVAEGGRVFGLDVSQEGLDATIAAATGPGSIATRVADITDAAQTASAVEAAVAELGGIDVLLNIAGIHATTPITHFDMDVMRRLFEVNVFGTIAITHDAIPYLSDGGAIVSVSSLSALQGNPFMSAYAATKGAVLSFSRTIAAELVDRRIRVNTVSPGSVATPLTSSVPDDVAKAGLNMAYYARLVSPWGAAEPEQIASVIAFAASEDASYISGVDIPIDGAAFI